jgi:uncharacterized membrane protein HdeD (DUF308 family)
METKLYKNWWFLALNGVIAILIGLLFLFYTITLLASIINAVGIIILAGGLVQLILALYYFKKDKRMVSSFILAVIFFTIGICILLFQQSSQALFFIMMGVWAVIVGIFQLVILINVKRNLSNKNIILFNGLLTIILGALFFLNPSTFNDIVIKILGVFTVIFGVVMIYLSFVIRKVTLAGEKEEAYK